MIANPEAPKRVTIPEPMLKQEAPFPKALAMLVESLEYRPGWRFRLCHYDRGQDSIGLTLIIVTQGYDSYNPDGGETYRVQHFMPVPPAAYNEQSWQRWLLEQCLAVERHECCEFFKINGKRPYAPHHGPGNDPYIIFERGTDEDARTMYTGEVRPSKMDQLKPNHDKSTDRPVGPGIKSYTADQLEVARRNGGVVSDQGKDSEGDRLVPRHAPPRPPPSEATHYPPDRPPRPHPSEPFRKG